MKVARDPARSALAAVITSLLLLSSLLALVATPAMSAASAGPSTAQVTPGSHTRLVPDWNGMSWDWSQYADGSGEVSAIISDQDMGSYASVEATHPGEVRTEFTKAFTGYSVHMPVAELESVLASDPTIQAYPDLEVKASLVDSVPAIGADQVWTTFDSYGNPVKGLGVVVAVIDTGVDYLHPDLGGGFGPGYKVIGGYDFYNNDSDPMDDNGHGTHVAGIIAASGGITGVAPQASILAYKTLGPDGTGSMSLVMKAIEAAMDPNGDGNTADHADVISMSLGGSGEPDDPVCIAVENAIAVGVVVVVAAGNSGPGMNTVASPGLAPDAITVGAVDDSGVLATFSSRGPTKDLSIKPEVSAPGVMIDSTVPYSNAAHSSPSGHMALSGTSMATPHVSGAAALLLQKHPSWTPAQVKSALVLGAKAIGESVWAAGAGEIWVPASESMDSFVTLPVVSLGLAASKQVSVTISSSRTSSMTLSVSPQDCFAMGANGTDLGRVWTNMSYSAQSYVNLPALGSGSLTIGTSTPASSAPEGYYDGWIVLSDATHNLRVPFGFVVLSKVSVHVMDLSGTEVFDPYGGVWAFQTPGAGVALSRRGNSEPAPPANFLLPSGTYCIVAGGHQLLYDYNDPYLLSTTVSVGRLDTVNLTLNMSSAHQMAIDLSTPDGLPIYVKDFRAYVRYVGTERNISFDLTGSDYSIRGTDVFSIPSSKTMLVSDIPARVGISLAGFSYTPDMWDFMQRNGDHWYEWIDGTSTDFYVEATADLQYLLSWEFDSVTSSTPTSLGLDPARAHYYVTKYDIPGTITSPWNNWGDHRSIGGDSVFFVRRDTDTSVNNFFSGMNRTTIVQGPFTELYFPEGLFSGMVERQYYSPDLAHLVRASTASEIYMPDRAWLIPVGSGTTYGRLGSGPYYPSAVLSVSSDEFTLYQPLLREASGARVGEASQPSMSLYRDGGLVGIYQLSEYLTRPDAVRVVSLPGTGSFTAVITMQPLAQVYDDATIEFGFTPGLTDPNPPTMTSMQFPQRFVPGQSLGLTFTGSDSSALTASASWRPDEASAWAPVSVTSLGGGRFSTSIQTLSTTASVFLKMRLTDASGNYLDYIADRASIAQTHVTFTLSPSVTDIDYRAGDFTIPLAGSLEDASGSPLSPTGGVPIELWVGARKVGMILDEAVSTGSHTHDGTIAFNWVVDPTRLFTAQDQTITVTAKFDLGTYEPVTRTFTLRSVAPSDLPPLVTSSTPSGSLIAAGTLVPLQVTDDGVATALTYSLDGGASTPLVLLPVSTGVWRAEVQTSSWSEGAHTIVATATDNAGLKSVPFSINVLIDSAKPTISLMNITNGQTVPQGWMFEILAQDTHLSSFSWQVDSYPTTWRNGTLTAVLEPVNTSAYSVATHSLKTFASDLVGHRAWANISFTISDSSVVVSLISPQPDGLGEIVIMPGVQLELSVIGYGTIGCTWSEAGTVHSIGAPYSISTSGWSDGDHEILVNASNSLGMSDSLTISVTVDGTAPTVSMTPSDGSYVTETDIVKIFASDAMFDHLVWTAFGASVPTTNPTPQLLVGTHTEGPITVGVTAYDRAGNSVSVQYTFNLDISPPTVTLDTIKDYSQGSSAVISGNASDAVSPVTAALWYELRDHTYAHRDLTLAGSAFSDTLASDLLWDGMKVYVSAADAVGHLSETNRTIISAAGPAPPGGDGSNNKTDNDTSQYGPYLLIGSWHIPILLIVVLVIGASAIIVLVAFARRRKAPKEKPIARPPTRPLPAVPERLVLPDRSFKDEWNVRFPEIQPAVMAAEDIERPAPERTRPAVAESRPRTGLVKAMREKQAEKADLEELLPSIPPETAKAWREEPRGPEQPKEPEIDYGELIERELNEGIRRRSALDDEFDEFFKDRGRDAVDTDTPGLASGLKLKVFMEEEERRRKKDL